MINLQTIVDELNEIIKSKKFTQSRVVKLAGISKDVVNKVLSVSRKNIETDTLFSIMNSVEMSSNELL